MHVDPLDAPDDLRLLTIELPDDIGIERVEVADLPARWIQVPAPDELAALGTDWLMSRRSVALSVPSAVIPIVTMMGLQFGFLLGGSIVVEKVFNWPGLGRLLVDSVEARDYPVIQAEVLLFSLEFILINLIVDMLYAAINPTIKYK